jgi:hypothetical protein
LVIIREMRGSVQKGIAQKKMARIISENNARRD